MISPITVLNCHVGFLMPPCGQICNIAQFCLAIIFGFVNPLQEWSADLNRTLSRREKKKPGEGVTLTGISQAGEQSVQNKHSR